MLYAEYREEVGKILLFNNSVKYYDRGENQGLFVLDPADARSLLTSLKEELKVYDKDSKAHVKSIEKTRAKINTAVIQNNEYYSKLEGKPGESAITDIHMNDEKNKLFDAIKEYLPEQIVDALFKIKVESNREVKYTLIDELIRSIMFSDTSKAGK